MRHKSMDNENKYEAVAETSVLYGNNRALAALAFYHGMYAMAAAEAEGLKVKARIQAPAGTEKSYVSWLKQDLREKSKKEGIRKAEIETAVNGALLVPEVTVTISGVTEKKRKGSKEAEEKAVVMTKWAGMEGMLRIVSEKQEERSRYCAACGPWRDTCRAVAPGRANRWRNEDRYEEDPRFTGNHRGM